MWIDFRPLIRNRDFRYLYFGQFVSLIGTMLTMVALPFQVYQLSHSTFAVGMMGIVELVPLLFTAFIGGALADTMDRRKLLIWAELGMGIGCLALVTNALLPEPKLWVLYCMAGFLSALTGLHRPSLDAMKPRLVQHHEIQAVSALSALMSGTAMVGGPAIAGICISSLGIAWTFGIDFLTFIISLFAISKIRSIKVLEKQDPPSLKSIKEALHYAVKRQELLGTYIVDIVAMVFGMPNALFPAVSQAYGGAKVVGWLYSMPAVGVLVVSLLSGWTKYVKRQGMAVAFAATAWGLAITGFGLVENWFAALFFLALAGAADGVSGIFRSTIWNETIPDKIRGRMAGLEMLGYMTGPLMGNAEAGLVASLTTTQISIISGGVLCILGVILCTILLPGFWKYRQEKAAY